MKSAAPISVALATAGLMATAVSAQIADRRRPPQLIRENLGVAVPMRDGIRLTANVYLPAGTGRWPTVFVRTPYDRRGPAASSYRYFLRHGYAVVIQDVRGRYGSQGIFGPIEQEGPDGSDTLNWIASQPWSNGRVAMAGSSYLGLTDWWAAIENNPHLKAISPMYSGDDEYLDRYYSPGGALQLGHRLLWLAENFTLPTEVKPLFKSYIYDLPLQTADVSATGHILPLWRGAIAHPSEDSYWRKSSIRERMRNVSVPVLSFAGWFDTYAESDLDAFSRLSRRHVPVETWVGPWAHNPGWKFPTRDFGRQAEIGIRSKQAQWFDTWMAAAGSEAITVNGEPELHVFIMGPNVWREEHEWPLARTRYTPLYLSSSGHANTASGDGSLRWQPVRKSAPDTFTYDPRNPVPTAGGSTCCEPQILPPGPLDQTRVERRDDVLVYTSEPLPEEVEVTGPVRVILYVSTSTNDTDFTAKLVDVQPQGRPLLVTDGIQRLRYRLSLDRPVFVKRNTAYQISVDAGVTSYVFAPGHRIRLEVSSSNFPRFDRSLNTIRPNGEESKLTKARQTVLHEKGYPSAVVLPIIPRSTPRGGSANPERQQPRPQG
ncbi:MAG: CocE/NonD family hydrolase [Acidobacteriaceae bacterium]|nr:CocE/NonD family hydrolase [Acidobacteriaceae bacterium]